MELDNIMCELTRPTKGLISVTPASAQATAWPNPNKRVKLQWIPSSFSNSLAAWIPSQVEAILIKILSFSIPTDLYKSMSWWAFAFVAALSKERRASTSVDTRPGMIARISLPNSTSWWENRWSAVMVRLEWRYVPIGQWRILLVRQ